MRVGTIVKLLPDRKIGFIRSEGLREDVFFHLSQVENLRVRTLREGDELQFEIDELARLEKRPLRATRVVWPDRPLTRRLKVTEAPHLHAQHHPRARQRRPVWRRRQDPSVGEQSQGHPLDPDNE
ncbi:MAG: cold-shock protein [Pirellulaceae bacterium]|nr:MAG: cold-shock protein [Pirellulaceae bacterium]